MVDLSNVFRLCRAAGRGMLARGSGKIINIASMLAFQGGTRVPAYAAAKGGVAQLTKALANEWAGARRERQRDRARLHADRQHAGASRRSGPATTPSRRGFPPAAGASPRISPAPSSSWPRRPPTTCTDMCSPWTADGSRDESHGDRSVTAAIEEAGVVAVIRMQEPDALRAVIDAIADGGVRALEVTMTVPGAVDLIRGLSPTLPGDFLLGAGTVLDAQTAARVIDAGARFVVSPVFRPAIIDVCHRTRRRGAAGLLHADRDPDRVGVGRGHRQGVPGDGARTVVLQGRARTAAAA